MYGETPQFGPRDEPNAEERLAYDYGREYEGRKPQNAHEDEQAAIDKELGQSPQVAAQAAEELRILQEQMQAAGKEPKHVPSRPEE